MAGSAQAPSPPPKVPPSDEVLHYILFYGGLFVGLFLLYCVLRSRYSQLYYARNFAGRATPYSLDAAFHSFFGWIWAAITVSDEQLFQQSGLDSLTLVHWAQFGLKVCRYVPGAPLCPPPPPRRAPAGTAPGRGGGAHG